MHDNEQLKLEEYRSLQEEHRKNRGYIFGSPVLVLGIVAAGIEYSAKTGLDNPLIFAILIFIICYSIWFLGNRLRSDARIVSYIQLVHEGEYQSKWMGWESILREYRIWYHTHQEKGDFKTLQEEKLDKDAIPSALMFYPAIWLFYILLVLSIVALVIFKIIDVLKLPAGLHSTHIVSAAATVIATGYFFYYAFGKLYPEHLNAVYERERANWLCILGELKAQTNAK